MKNKYDVIIIGAGIGGLTCGCYLAKAGLKVLIVEKHNRLGGCCSSFERKGFRFDVGVHYLGSLRRGGALFDILVDLGLLERFQFLRSDITDRIILDDKTIFFKKSFLETEKELFINFPKEKENIKNFINFVCKCNLIEAFRKTNRFTFKQLLDSFFFDPKLKSLFSVLLGNIGLPPSKAAAFISLVTLREFVFDGGYYPKGGIQIFPDLLGHRFKEFGGKLLLNEKVSKIVTKNNKSCGIELETGNFLSSKVVVSNADATLTFKKLLDCASIEARKVNKLQFSTSAFVVYLGLNDSLNNLPKHYTTWLFQTCNIQKCYNDTNLLNLPILKYALCSFPSLIDNSLAPKGKSILRIFVLSEYPSKDKLEEYRERAYDMVLKKAENLVPNLKSLIEVKEIGTPITFEKFTFNRKGALFGWSGTPNQLDRTVFPFETSISNLFLTGHWVTNGVGQSGVAVVAFSGKRTAKTIIRNFKLLKK